MSSIQLIFTTDYEVFGNGSGSVPNCMIQPTASMASILEKHGATLTIFFDVCEFWAFEHEYVNGNLKEDWAGMIREQLQQLVAAGHDVQLHFHPQWLDYQFDGLQWTLNFDLWRIGTLKYEDADHPERSLKTLFKRGKETLEEMLRPVKPDYRCHIFRAGAWSMQPEGDVLKAMTENGFDIDSTVVPGVSFQDDYTYYDFRSAPNNIPSWRISNALNTPDQSGKILEIPIYSSPSNLWTNLKFQWIKRRKSISMKPKGCSGSALTASGKSRWSKIREVLFARNLMFTFGDATSTEEMIHQAKASLSKAQRFKLNDMSVVTISHPKTFANEAELEGFLNWCKTQDKIHFGDYNTIANS